MVSDAICCCSESPFSSIDLLCFLSQACFLRSLSFSSLALLDSSDFPSFHRRFLSCCCRTFPFNSSSSQFLPTCTARFCFSLACFFCNLSFTCLSFFAPSDSPSCHRRFLWEAFSFLFSCHFQLSFPIFCHHFQSCCSVFRTFFVQLLLSVFLVHFKFFGPHLFSFLL